MQENFLSPGGIELLIHVSSVLPVTGRDAEN